MGECMERVFLRKWIPVGHGGQINRLTDKLACNKWPTDILEHEMAGNNKWQV
jgi:hypothetical protein